MSPSDSGGGDRPRPEAAAPAAAVPAESPGRSLRDTVLDLLLTEPLTLTGAEDFPFKGGMTKLPARGADGPEDAESPDGSSLDRVRPIFLEGV